MSADIFIFPTVRVERQGEASGKIHDNCKTVTFCVTVREDLADLIRQSARDWGATPEQFLAETIEDSLINPFGAK